MTPEAFSTLRVSEDAWRCYCGECASCLEIVSRAQYRRKVAIAKKQCRCGNRGCDCAKWDDIYKAKFEDPTYYLTAAVQGRSSAAYLPPPDTGGQRKSRPK